MFRVAALNRDNPAEPGFDLNSMGRDGTVRHP